MAVVLPFLGPVLGVVAKFGEYLVPPVKRQFSYMCHYGSNIDNLREQIEKLEHVETGVKLLVDAAKRNKEIIGGDVENWLRKVDNIKSKIYSILEETAKVEEGCLNGWGRNIKSRYSLGRKVHKITEVVCELQSAGKFERVSYPAASPGIEFIPLGNGEEFKSRISIEEGIIAALKNDNIDIVGVCGMGGVGKTRMVKRIWKRAREENIFDEVVMAVVTQQPDSRRIQAEIADWLHLKLMEQSLWVRASRLHSRLKDVKRILVILDDIWARIDLEEIGIPHGSVHRGCKILLTSRNRDVCLEMNAHETIFTINPLSSEEAWFLFKDKAGESVNAPDLNPVAMEMVDECKGLPIALITVGRAIRNKSLQFWQDALLQLKRALPVSLPGVLKDVYRPLELSYIYLESDEAKYVFLLCCLFREDSSIPLQTLARYGMGLNIFEGIEDLEEARARVQGLIEMLKDRFLLVDVENNRSAKMHDVVRDVAIFIATKDKKIFMVSHDASLRVWPRKNTYENITCISVISSTIIQLPRGLYCPKIELLQLECNNQGVEVQDEFFDGMIKLKVLDMQCLSISSLPSSFQMLIKLQTLHLTKFHNLENISIISKLVNLEILSFCGSYIKEFPAELGSLTNLRLLDLNECSALKTIAPGVISRFVQLEQLNMRSSFHQWEPESDGRQNAALIELESLPNLTTLEVEVPDPGVFPKKMRMNLKLRKYALSMYHSSSGERRDENIKISHFEKLVGLSLPFFTTIPDAVTHLLRGTEVLHLRGKGAVNAMSELIQEGCKCLKELQINDCAMLEYLANAEMYQPPITGVFPLLESLNLRSLGNLEEICRGQLPEGSFQGLRHLKLVELPMLMQFCSAVSQNISFTKLTSVYVNNCENLRSLFSHSIVRGLAQLEKLQIINCSMIAEVFSHESEEDGETDKVIEFSRLNYLKFQDLPSLTSFCKDVDAICFPRLSNLDIYDLPAFKSFFPPASSPNSTCNNNAICSLFSKNVTVKGLKRLRLCKLDSMSNIWCYNFSTDFFKDLEILEVEACISLRTLFSSSMANSLVQLRRLKIRDCSAMEAIIEQYETREGQKINETLFPHLKRLELLNLPNIRSFYFIKSFIEMPSVEEMIISHCPMIKAFSFELPYLYNYVQCLFYKVAFAGLKRLELCKLSYVNEIWHNEVQIEFSSIEVLIVKSCDNLKHLFSFSMAKALLHLKELQISDCKMMREVIAEQEKEEQAQQSPALPIFPALKHLELMDLHNLRSFCNIKHALELPLLEHIKVGHCSEMETFSLGSLETPNLKCLDPDYISVNHTIQQGFQENEARKLRYLAEYWGERLNRPRKPL